MLYHRALTTKFKGTFEGMEIAASINWTVSEDPKYGADADGNRGVSRTEYEPESFYNVEVNGSEDLFNSLPKNTKGMIEQYIFDNAEFSL